MRFLSLITGITLLIATNASLQTPSEVRIHILENSELLGRVENTLHLRNRSLAIKLRQSLSEPIYWGFKAQKSDLREGQIRLVYGTPISIESSLSDLSMSEKEYVTLLKQDGISPAIEVSTQEKQYWFTLFPKDYAIQTDITRIVAQLKESSGEQGDPQNRMKSLDEEVNSVLRQVDGFWKSGTSLSEVKSLKELETELGKAREEKADLQRELDALQRQYEMTTQQKKTVQQNTAKSTNSIKQLETEVGRLKSGRDQLQHEVGVLQGKYEEATQQFERLQNKVQKLRVIYPGGQSPLEREAIIAPTSLAKVGTLELQIAPTEAALFLDEVAVGYGTAITAQLPVGWHSVTVTAEGYGPQHIMVNIQAGGTLKRTLHLSPE